MNMIVCITAFKKRESRLITHQSGVAVAQLETLAVKEEEVCRLRYAEMRIVWWMCGASLSDMLGEVQILDEGL